MDGGVSVLHNTSDTSGSPNLILMLSGGRISGMAAEKTPPTMATGDDDEGREGDVLQMVSDLGLYLSTKLRAVKDWLVLQFNDKEMINCPGEGGYNGPVRK